MWHRNKIPTIKESGTQEVRSYITNHVTVTPKLVPDFSARPLLHVRIFMPKTANEADREYALQEVKLYLSNTLTNQHEMSYLIKIPNRK